MPMPVGLSAFVVVPGVGRAAAGPAALEAALGWLAVRVQRRRIWGVFGLWKSGGELGWL